MKELSKKRLRYLIADEKKAAKMYRRYGFKGLAHDESRHRRFLQRRLREEKR